MTFADVKFGLVTNWRGGDVVIQLNVNGKPYSVDVEPETPLLWVIREQIGLTGTKYGCGIGRCGACTVHLNGQPVHSCGRAGIGGGGRAHYHHRRSCRGQASCTRCSGPGSHNDVPQCGYCQSGMIMAVAALLAKKPKPTDADIDAAITNICRCGTFQQVREAIHMAAKA